MRGPGLFLWGAILRGQRFFNSYIMASHHRNRLFPHTESHRRTQNDTHLAGIAVRYFDCVLDKGWVVHSKNFSRITSSLVELLYTSS